MTIPSVVGQTAEDAVAELTRAGLVAQVVEVNSDRDEGTVTAQSPSAGTVVVEGTQVRVNVSKGPRPVNVPNVVGLPYDQAASELQRAGFVVSRIDEDSDQAAGIVTRQTPSGGSEGSRGSTVTVSVSKGPSTAAVPDVTAQDVAIAQTTLQAAGFRFRIVYEDTDDFAQDGIVNAQDPVGGSQAEPNTIVTLFVGRFVETENDNDHAVSSRVRVAVLAGGRSSEHEISLASARSVVAALDPERYDTVVVEIDKGGRWELAAGRAHELTRQRASRRCRWSRTQRPRPRSGRSTSYCRSCTARSGRTARCRASSSSPACPTSAQASPRRLSAWTRTSSRRFSATAGSPSRATSRFAKETSPAHDFDYPVFVKPARLGSSVGISKVRSDDELRAAVELARRHDDKVLIEEGVDGVEVECGVLGNRDPIASVVGEIVAHADWYDYSAKYDEGGMDLVIPARISPTADADVRRLAVDSFVATECEGMARIDFFVRPDGEVVVNEINTIPGFTSTSVYAKLFEAAGISYAELLDRLIALALERHERRAQLLD